MSEQHSKYYEIVKRDYDNGSWNLYRIKRAVAKGWITEDEFTEITKIKYEP